VFHVVRPCRNDKEIRMMLSKEIMTLFNSDKETDMILSEEVIISCNKRQADKCDFTGTMCGNGQKDKETNMILCKERMTT
jgi:hypothetical protein